MAAMRDTSTFFTEGTPSQYKYVLSLYPQALKLKAERKTKKPEELIKLDNWYQNELPKKIKSRGKDAHLNHEELCQLMKWKQTRGKAYPQLNYLVKVNTPRAVMAETKKAFKKLPNLEQAITALSNLKGVGTTMASALLAAAAPEKAAFMADECLMAIPDIEGIDYTTKEYLNFVQIIQSTANRLNSEMPNGPNGGWNAHKVELALWTHFVASELSPELLDSIPETNGKSSHQNGECVPNENNESDGENSRGQLSSDQAAADSADDSRGQLETEPTTAVEDENSNADPQEDSATSDNSQRVEEEVTNHSADSTEAVDATDEDSSAEPPPSKKSRGED